MAAAALANLAGRLAAGNAGPLDKVAGGLDKLAASGKTALSSITSLATSISGALLSPLDSARKMVESIGNLVRLFNPGILVQFQLTLNDTLAVIGSALVPVMQGLTIYVRAFGDVLAGLLPVIRPLFDAIGRYAANFAQGLLPMFQAAAPFIELFTDGMVLLIDKLSLGVAFLQGVVAELITMVANLFGLESDFNAKASSKGFAARQTKVGSVEQFASDLFASTAKNIYARGDQGVKKPEAILEEIKAMMIQGRKTVGEIASDVRIVARHIRAFVRGFGKGLEQFGDGFDQGAKEVAELPFAIPLEIARALDRWFSGKGAKKPW
jgi:hypothetical protein